MKCKKITLPAGLFRKDFDWIVNSFVFSQTRDILSRGAVICREFLHDFVSTDQISLVVPAYRRFHVIPSTQIAQIIRQYITSMKMKLDGGEGLLSLQIILVVEKYIIEGALKPVLNREGNNIPLPSILTYLQ